MDDLGRCIEALKATVSDKLACSDGKERIHLIHMLVSLGVAYHFEKQIEEFLKDSFEKVEEMTIGEEDLYTISVIFRVFRLYGHKLSADVFKRFKEENGDFKKCLINDIRGMLSFYEASHFGTTTEGILDEAMHFTQKHLELFVGGTNEAHISGLIKHVLYLSQKENIEVLMAREYIRFYEQETHHDEMLLKFAKLNFKFMQLHYIQELQTIVKWWKELDLESKIPNYFRSRIVESLFWAMGVYMEPQYSVARIILTKCLLYLTIMDDLFDAYCTLTEVIDFSESLERWDADATNMPDHMKTFLRSLIDFFEDLKGEVRSEGRLYSLQYAIDEIKRLFRANLAIAKWARTGYIPNFDEYMEVGLVTGGIDCIAAVAFIGMGEIAGTEAYDWLISSRPKLIQTLDLKGRLRDDVATYKDEMARGEIATGINCHMKQYKVNKEEAFLEFDKKIKHTSKLVNQEYIRTTMPLNLLRVVFNIGRIIDVNYKYGDGFTYKEMVEGQISSLFLELITI